MPTLKQIEANRRNAQKSTGPVTPAGKAASSMNALKSGLHAKSLIIPGEKAEDYQALIDEYYSHHRPQTPEARAILDDLISCEWQLRRLMVSEAQMWKYQLDDIWDKDRQQHPRGKVASNHFKSHAALQRRLDSTRRARDRALALLREHDANPIPVPPPLPEAPSVTPTPPTTSPEIGFVPSPPSAALANPAKEPDHTA